MTATCPTCGGPCGPPLSAKLADQGFDPLEHCIIAAIYAGKPRVPCMGRSVARQCHLCKIGNALGTWLYKRGTWTFTPKEKRTNDPR